MSNLFAIHSLGIQLQVRRDNNGLHSRTNSLETLAQQM